MVIVVWTLAAFELYIAISFAVSKSVRPSRLATEPVWSTAMMRRVADARSKFAAAKRNEGARASLRLTAGNLERLAAIGLARSAKRLGSFAQDLLAALPLSNLLRRRGVLFIGYIEANLGLGESLRGLVRSLATTELPFALHPFNLGVETRLIGGFMEDRYDLKRRYQINVIELAADQVPGMFDQLGRWRTRYSYNILRTYWELPRAPAEWATMLTGIREIWAPNDFVRDAFLGVFDGPIVIVPPCVEVAQESDFARADFGMEEGRFYFIFSFDYFSLPARKNPLGVVQAFRAAFPDLAENVGLVVKSTSAADHYPDIKSAILEAAQSDHRIKVIDRILSRSAMMSLIRQSDCYVSLHRSEGFGLGMAEAMANGKPVIGTDYSGSTDFLSDRTGFPVPFTLRALQPGEYIFWDGQSWAEPDQAAAAKAMRDVFYDRDQRQRRAAAGKTLVEARYGRENVGRIAAQRLREILAKGGTLARTRTPGARSRA
jgi:glycosyltransferase involved in cell wall biosynthesis